MRSGLILLYLLPLAAAEDPLPYPKGSSTQTHKGRKFELRIPEQPSADGRYSLMFVVGGGTDPFFGLLADGFVLCASRQRKPGSWSASEAKELRGLLDHLVKVLPIDKARLHAAGGEDWQGFFPQVAFRKGGNSFASVCFERVAFRGGSPPPGAKKKLGVLILGDDPKFDESKIVEALRGKVRSVEYRPSLATDSEYFRYWVHVMEGRFTPGVDRSFRWTTEIEAAKTRMAKERKGGFLYFYSSADTSSEAARQLQNRVFFDHEVRLQGNKLVAILADKDQHAALFSSFALKSTPAVVVLDPDFEAQKTFEGKVKAKALSKALRAAAKGR